MRRSRFDIIVDVLTTSIEGANKTRIVYDANLNFKVAKEYLDFLIEAGLLEEVSESKRRVYRTTEKGIALLTSFKELIEVANL